jgi:hypothetical protein
MSEVIQPDGLPQSPAERAARVMYRLGFGYDIDADESVRATMIAAADQVLKSSGVLAYDPVTKVILDNCARHYFEWKITSRWRLRARRRNHALYTSAVDRLIQHVQGKVLLQEVCPTVAQAVELWGVDPQQWPGWFCPNCGQRGCGWSLECGRCEAPRIVRCFSTHGGSGWSEGTTTLDGEHVVCGACGTIIPWPSTTYLPEWVKPR